MKVWHIFSRAIDNFGDLAISLRLSQQISEQINCKVTLFTEFNEALFSLIPKIDSNTVVFLMDNLEIRSINQPFNVIEAPTHIVNIFNIPIPDDYLILINKPTRYIIYEYLSAEKWVDGFHLKSSINLNCFLDQVYFFPGFTKNTGGLLIDEKKPKNHYLKFFRNTSEKDWLDFFNVSIFCYSHSNIQSVLNVNKSLKINIYIPELIINKYKAIIEWPKHLVAYPFLSFADYDSLLGLCDLNFVRGEDSLVRAIISGKPFIWQPYIQENGAHFLKLNAFIDFYFSELQESLFKIISNIFKEWAAGKIPLELFKEFFSRIDEFNVYFIYKSELVLSQKRVINNLMEYC